MVPTGEGVNVPDRRSAARRAAKRFFIFTAWPLVRGLIRLKSLLAYRRQTPRLYRKWIDKYAAITPRLRAAMTADAATWPARPLISVIMPISNVDPKWLSEAIGSVRAQIYPHWELCISGDASTAAGSRSPLEHQAAQDKRIHLTFGTESGHASVNSNSALALASGDYIALLDADDLLSEDALFWAAREIALHPEVDLLFSDEDKIDDRGRLFDPYFKSAWNAALMLSQNAFGHLGVYRRRVVEEVGGFRPRYEGAEDYDLTLRCSERTSADRIRHIQRVLYHRRTPASSTSDQSNAWNAGRSAIADHFQRLRIHAQVEPARGGYYQIDYDPPEPRPTVSIVVPTTLSNATTAKCLASVLSKSSYDNFDLLIVARADHIRAAKNDPQFAPLLANPRLRTVEYEEMPFNFSWVCNYGAAAARGALFCFLNDDVEVITEDWLERLVSRVRLDGVGAAGPTLYYPNNLIQHAGVVLGSGGVADHAFRRSRRGYLGYFGRAGLEQDYSCVTAACLVIKREVFDAAGGFDESLPVAFNDVDLCIRIRRTGARIVFVPSVEMYHHELHTLGHHAAPDRRSQFRHDVDLMRQRWNAILENDPCYNPNLSLVRGSMFCLAWPPRRPDPMDVVYSSGKLSMSRTSRLV